MAKFTNLTPLSLLIYCKLAFPIVGLKMSSLPILTLKLVQLEELDKLKKLNYLMGSRTRNLPACCIVSSQCGENCDLQLPDTVYS
jgi:hypothetical protein